MASRAISRTCWRHSERERERESRSVGEVDKKTGRWPVSPRGHYESYFTPAAQRRGHFYSNGQALRLLTNTQTRKKESKHDSSGNKKRLCSLCLCSFCFHHHPPCPFYEFAFGSSIHCVCFDLEPTLPILICHNPCFVLPLFFFLPSSLFPTQIPPPSPSPPFAAYLDDEEDEDPFGDYVISKSHLIVSSRLLGPQWTRLPLRDCVLMCLCARIRAFFSVAWCFCERKNRSVTRNIIVSNWAPAGKAERRRESAERLAPETAALL